MVSTSILLRVQRFFHTANKCLPGIVISIYLLLLKKTFISQQKSKNSLRLPAEEQHKFTYYKAYLHHGHFYCPLLSFDLSVPLSFF